MQGFFYTFEKKSRRNKSKFFGLQPKTQALFFQKKPQASGNFKHMTIFFKKNLNIFKAVKGNFLCIFNPKLEKKRKNRAMQAKNSTFPPIFAQIN